MGTGTGYYRGRWVYAKTLAWLFFSPSFFRTLWHTNLSAYTPIHQSIHLSLPFFSPPTPAEKRILTYLHTYIHMQGGAKLVWCLSKSFCTRAWLRKHGILSTFGTRSVSFLGLVCSQVFVYMREKEEIIISFPIKFSRAPILSSTHTIHTHYAG